MTTLTNNRMPKWVFWIFLIITIAVYLALFGCVTEKKRAKICSTCPVKDSISYVEKVEYIRHDTTIYVTTSPIINIDTLYCDSLGIIKAFKRTWVKDGIKQTLSIKNNVATIECSDDSLKIIIAGLNKEKNTIMAEVRTSLRTQIQYIEHWYIWPLIIWGVISFIIFGIKLLLMWLEAKFPH